VGVRERSAPDGRRQVVGLTEAGGTTFATLDERSAAQVRGLLEGVTEEDRRRLVANMAAIQEILTRAPKAEPYVIRPPRPGDLGWVVHRHGVLYSQEYGWGEEFEALVARIVADYVDGHDPRRDAGWIAEVDGERAGCVFCVHKDDAQDAAVEIKECMDSIVDPEVYGVAVTTSPTIALRWGNLKD